MVDKKVMKDRILEVAYQQLTSEYPSFAQFIVKYSLDEINESGKSAIGSFRIIIGKNVFTIPIIYRDGNVDATSYIGNDKTDRYYALTKSLYNKIVNNIANTLGAYVSPEDAQDKSKGNQVVVDRGIIGSLFATPTTMSPKVASYSNDSSLLEDIAFSDREFAKTLVKEASKDTYIAKTIREIVDVNSVKRMVDSYEMAKTASKKPNIDTVVFFDRDSIVKNIPSYELSTALTKLATDGFYVKRYKDDNVNAILGVPTPKELIHSNFLNSLEVVSDGGNWTLFDKTFSPIYCVVLKDINRFLRQKANIYDGSELIVTDCCVTSGVPNGVVGIKNKSTIFNDNINSAIIKHLTEPKKAKYLIVSNGDDVNFFVDLRWDSGLTKIGENKYSIELDKTPFALVEQIIVVPSTETVKIIKRGSTLIVPDNKAFFIDDGENELSNKSKIFKRELLKENDLDSPVIELQKTASYITTRRDGKFLVDGSVLTKNEFIVKMAHEGINQEEIKEIIKTASNNKEVTIPLVQLNQQIANMLQQLQIQGTTLQKTVELLSAIKGELSKQNKNSKEQSDLLKQMFSNQHTDQGSANNPDVVNQIKELASQIGQDPSDLINQAKSAGMSLDDLLLQLKNYIAQQPAQQDPNTQQPAQQDPNAQQQMQQDPNAQQQMQQDPNVPNTDENGFITNNLSPDVIEVLKELADKKVLESSIISYLSTLNTPKSTIKSYTDKIKDGVNGMVKILMIVDSNYYKMLDNVSEGALSSFLSKGKALAKKMTDFVIGIESM
jgi:hypothetical protein